MDSAPPTDPAMLAVQLTVDEGVQRVLVVDETKRLIGIITPIHVCKAVRAEKSLSETRYELGVRGTSSAA